MKKALHKGLQTPPEAVPISSDEANEMMTALQGEWRVASAMVGEKPLPALNESGMLMGIHTSITVSRGDEDCCTKKCLLSDPFFGFLQSEATQFAQCQYSTATVAGNSMTLTNGGSRVSIVWGGLPSWKPMTHPLAFSKTPGGDGIVYMDSIGTVITTWEPEKGTVEFKTGLGTHVRLSNVQAQMQAQMMAGPLGAFKARHPNATVHTNCSSDQSHQQVRVKPSVFGGKTTVSANSDSGTSANGSGDPGMATSQVVIGPQHGAIPVLNAQPVGDVAMLGVRLLPQTVERS